MLHLQPWVGKHYRYWFDLFQGFSRATLTGKLWETYLVFARVSPARPTNPLRTTVRLRT
jgi:hypothetical protein